MSEFSTSTFLLCRLSRHGLYRRKAFDKVLRQSVSACQELRIVIRNPHLPTRVLPNKDLQRKVDGNAGSSLHERRSGLGVSKDQQFCRWHLHSRLLRLTAVVDQGKESNSL